MPAENTPCKALPDTARPCRIDRGSSRLDNPAAFRRSAHCGRRHQVRQNAEISASLFQAAALPIRLAPDTPALIEVSSELRMSHEAIYAISRGELLACLRQGKPHIADRGCPEARMSSLKEYR